MTNHEFIYRKVGRRWTCLAGVRIRRILSAELFLETSSPSRAVRESQSLADRCRDRWIDCAGALAALPRGASLHFVLACRPGRSATGPEFDNGFLALGHGATKTAARTACRRTLADLGSLIPAIIDYADFEPVADAATLVRMTSYLGAKYIVEFARRTDRIRVGRERQSGRVVMGFASEKQTGAPRRDSQALEIPHLFPWTPSDDPWWRLAEVMAREKGPTAVVVHLRGWNRAPATCREGANRGLAGVEGMLQAVGGGDDPLGVLDLKAGALRRELLHRLAVLEGPVVSARVFLAGRERTGDTLLSLLGSSLDDPSVPLDQPEARFLFRGGVQTESQRVNAMLEPFAEPRYEQLFSPREASAVLRTPMPTDNEFPGFAINRSRTASRLGPIGDDAPLGVNVHRGMVRDVRMAKDDRPRHCYVIGQTGTGKSTFLLHKVLHDIRQGRGVALLDPHGSLVDDVLRRYPADREDDLMVIDLTDISHPVGFNPLVIHDKNPATYRSRRDLLIDELYAYIDRTYDLKHTGGPIFETHFRGMLGLLMGVSSPEEPLIPNLMVFRQLYTNKNLRAELVKRIEGRDFMLQDFVREAMKVRSDASIENVAPYITSKFNRFISDVNLRNITCQGRTIDFDDVVDDRKVLLMNLGKGHIGEYAAGLLASQVVARIQGAIMRRGARKRGGPFCLYADEFQLVASLRFAELLAEGRKFGLAVTMAHQFASQVPDAVLHSILGNVGTMVLFRVGVRDAEFFEPQFAPAFGRRDLTSLTNFRAYVKEAGGRTSGAFNVDTPPPPCGGGAKRARSLRAASRRKFGRPRAKVEKEIMVTNRAYRDFRNE